jgi:hypothetical protein
MNNDLTNNDEVMDKVAEVTEEVVKAAPKSNNGLKVAGYGVAVLVGVALCHFAIEPTAAKISDLIQKHKDKKNESKVTVSEDGKIVDVEPEDDETEEN